MGSARAMQALQGASDGTTFSATRAVARSCSSDPSQPLGLSLTPLGRCRALAMALVLLSHARSRAAAQAVVRIRSASHGLR